MSANKHAIVEDLRPDAGQLRHRRPASDQPKARSRLPFVKDHPTKPLPWHLRVLRHTNIIVIALTSIGVLHLRTSHAVFFALSSTATSYTAKGLKRVIKQPRPEGSYNKRTHGMPSTHSSSVAFMGLYLGLAFLLLPLHPSVPVPAALTKTSPAFDASVATEPNMAVRAAYALISTAFPAIVIWSRVALGLHTPAQCAVGAALGATMAIGAFTVWNGAVAWGLPWATSGWFGHGIGSTLGITVDGWIQRVGKDLFKMY